jgi:uncharacterized membrane protein
MPDPSWSVSIVLPVVDVTAWNEPADRSRPRDDTASARPSGRGSGHPVATLMAICYADPATGSTAMFEVARRFDDLHIAADAVAVVIRDRSGQLTAITNARANSTGSAYAMFWCPLFAYLLFVPMLGMTFGTEITRLAGKIERLAITEHFERRVRELLRPSTSALFVVLEEDPAPVVATLAEFSGTVVTSRLSPEGHTRLLEALHGRPVVQR